MKESFQILGKKRLIGKSSGEDEGQHKENKKTFIVTTQHPASSP
jgi:hypothetical protein